MDRAALMSSSVWIVTEIAQAEADEKKIRHNSKPDACALEDVVSHTVINVPTYTQPALSTDPNLAKGYFGEEGMLPLC